MDQFTGSYNMLKHGLRSVILIFTIIHVTFGGITETKGLVFDFLIFSQFSLIFSHKRNCYTKQDSNSNFFINKSSQGRKSVREKSTFLCKLSFIQKKSNLALLVNFIKTFFWFPTFLLTKILMKGNLFMKLLQIWF